MSFLKSCLLAGRDIQIKKSKLFLHQEKKKKKKKNPLCTQKKKKKKKKIEETVPIPSQGTDSGNKETDNEYDRNQGNYENDKICYNG